MKNLESKSRKGEVTRNAFKKLGGLHLPSLLQKVCAHMNLKDSTLRSTLNYIDALITEQWVIFHLAIRTISSMSTRTQVCVSVASSVREGSRTQPAFLHPYSCRCEDPSRSCSTGHEATENWAGKLGFLGGRQNYEVSVAVAKMENVDQCTSVADWKQGRTSITEDAGRAETTANED